MFKQVADLYRQTPPDRVRDHVQPEDRVPAQGEEVVVDIDQLTRQDIAPDLQQQRLVIILQWLIVLLRRLPRRLLQVVLQVGQPGKSRKIGLAAGSLRNLPQCDDPSGHRGGRKPLAA